MKWVKVISFVILVAVVFGFIAAIIGIPEFIAMPIACIIGVVSMFYAMDHWDLL